MIRSITTKEKSHLCRTRPSLISTNCVLHPQILMFSRQLLGVPVEATSLLLWAGVCDRQRLSQKVACVQRGAFMTTSQSMTGRRDKTVKSQAPALPSTVSILHLAA